MRRLLYHFKKFLWLCTVGFMIAWHNVYFQQDKLRDEDQMEEPTQFPDETSDQAPWEDVNIN